MKVLTLSVSPTVFSSILAGERDTVSKEIRPQNSAKFIEYFEKSDPSKVYETFDEVPDDVEIDARTLHYDALRLFSGKETGAQSIIVKVVSAQTIIILDKDGYANVYTYKGKEYVTARIVYGLGEIIEHNV